MRTCAKPWLDVIAQHGLYNMFDRAIGGPGFRATTKRETLAPWGF